MLNLCGMPDAACDCKHLDKAGSTLILANYLNISLYETTDSTML